MILSEKSFSHGLKEIKIIIGGEKDEFELFANAT